MVTLSTDSPLYPFATSSARLITNHKNLSYDLASKIGISHPDSVTIYPDDQVFKAATLLLETHGLVIVKPNSGSVSNGLTLNISRTDALPEAIKHARSFSDKVLVQQQVRGDEVRFVVVDGAVRAAILRQTPGVTGDGTTTLGQLIKDENVSRSSIVDTAVPYPRIDSDLVNMDAVNLDSIPALNERVELGKGTMIRLGASIYDVTETIHPSYLEIAEKLGVQLGNGFVVVDIMIHDYTKPAGNNNYAFIEYNLCPALQLFYSCRDGKHFDVVGDYIAPMIEMMLRKDLL